MEDAWFTILLHADIKTVMSYYRTHQLRILDHRHFWVEKFKHDDLPIFEIYTNTKDWFNEYKRVYNATIKTHGLLYMISREIHDDYTMHIELENIDQLPINNIIPNIDTLDISYDNTIYIHLSDEPVITVFNEQEDLDIKLVVTMDIVEKLLVYLFYNGYIGRKNTDLYDDKMLEYIVTQQHNKKNYIAREIERLTYRYKYWKRIKKLLL